MNLIPLNGTVFVVEEVCAGCGITERISHALTMKRRDVPVIALDLGKKFVTHGSMQDLYKHCHLDAAGIANKVREVLSNEN